MYTSVVEIPGMNEWTVHSISHYTLSPSWKQYDAKQGSAVCSDFFRDHAGGGAGGAHSLPPPLFRMVKYIFFYFGSPDLSLTTQTRFSNLTILNTHKQRTDKLCLVAVAKVFVALNDNRKANFAPSENPT